MKTLFLQSAISPFVIKYAELEDEETYTVHEEAAFELNAQYKASGELFHQIDEMLRRHAVAYRDIERIYIASGPGSYTGARLLVSIVKTMTVIYPHIAVYDASLLDIFLQASAGKTEEATPKLALVPARKHKYYFASELDGARGVDRVVSTEEAQQLIAEHETSYVNGQRLHGSCIVEHISKALDIKDWIAVSTQVEDVELYEPYYLEQVQIG